MKEIIYNAIVRARDSFDKQCVSVLSAAFEIVIIIDKPRCICQIEAIT